MANLVLNGKSIDSIDDIAENFVEADVMCAFQNGSLASWLDEYGYEDELERIRAIKPNASSIRVLAGISEALNLDDDVIAEAATRREEQRQKDEAARKASEERQHREEEEKRRKDEERRRNEENNKQNSNLSTTVQTPSESSGTSFPSTNGLYIDQDRCSGCGVCEEACPAEAIIEVDGQYRIDALECVDCGCCAESCPEEAILSGHYIDRFKCVQCGACARQCPSGAIIEYYGKYKIDASECVDCGCCVNVCPAEAIS